MFPDSVITCFLREGSEGERQVRQEGTSVMWHWYEIYSGRLLCLHKPPSPFSWGRKTHQAVAHTNQWANLTPPYSHNPIYDSTCGYLATILVSQREDYYDFRWENNWNQGLNSAPKGRGIVNLKLGQSYSKMTVLFSVKFPMKRQGACPQVKAFPTERELRPAVLWMVFSEPPAQVCFF